MSKPVKIIVIVGLILIVGTFILKKINGPAVKKGLYSAAELQVRADEYAKKRALRTKQLMDSQLATLLTVTLVQTKNVALPADYSAFLGNSDSATQELLEIERRRREQEAGARTVAESVAPAPVIPAAPRYSPSLQILQVRLKNGSWFTLRLANSLSPDMKKRLETVLQSRCLLVSNQTAQCGMTLPVTAELQAKLLNCDATKLGSIALTCGAGLDCLSSASAKFELKENVDPLDILAKVEQFKPTKDQCATAKETKNAAI